MKDQTTKRSLRCAIYTRVSTDQGLEQEFNSLDAQREACEAYIKSQGHEGWRLVRDRYNDGGFSGGSMDRPALQKLLIDVQARRIDVIVVYKVDRLTRSLAVLRKSDTRPCRPFSSHPHIREGSGRHDARRDLHANEIEEPGLRAEMRRIGSRSLRKFPLAIVRIDCERATHAPGIWIDETPIAIVWDEPMEGVGRSWFEWIAVQHLGALS
jgi:hypothetical protein